MMRFAMKRALLIFSLLFLAPPALAVEDLTLTSPLTRASTTGWRVQSLDLQWSAAVVVATFLDPTTGNTLTCTESGSAALTLMSTLNTANLTSNSLHKRTLNWAVGKGCLGAGAVSGTPQ